MADNRFEFQGLDELRAALRNLPEALAAEAAEVIDNRAELARSEIVQRYPRVTGNLRKGASVRERSAGQFGVVREVRSGASHAHLYEYGTQARHTKLGARRGAMRPMHVFASALIRHRRAMYEELKQLLIRQGLVVVGDA